MKRECDMGVFNRRGQVTVFVIIAIVIAAVIGGVFLFKNFYNPTIPDNLLPAYEYYISCANNVLKDGANTMASQGGYLESPDFYPGSEYAPFSSQLEFMGMGVPYWYYISANGLKKEQIPTKNKMQSELAKYLKQEISAKCRLDSFAQQGFDISLGEISSASASISGNKISGSFIQPISISLEEKKVSINNHKLSASSNLGNFYDLAKKIYSYEMKTSFLENYSVDVLYNYAPVSGAALNCSPVIWSPYKVVADLKKALSANVGMIKLSGNYYTIKTKTNNYFISGKNEVDVGNSQVSFLYSESWPSRFEVWPTKNNLMTAEPIGNQPGLGVLGFCYAPYKFVYDMYFPVLVQIYNPSDAEEVFQFPIAVVVNKNVPREALPSQYEEPQESLCDDDKKNAEITVNTYNVNLEPVEAQIEFKCLNDRCDLGKTIKQNYSDISSLTARVAQCGNGYLIAKADGYKDARYLISTNEENSADIILEKSYNIGVEIYVDGAPISSEMAVLTLSEKPLSEENSNNLGAGFASVVYPANKNMNLAEGNYEFDLKVYKSGSLVIPSTTSRQCASVPKTGIAGLFGFEEEKCTDINIPSQTLTNLLYAGGKVEQYITPTELESARTLKVYAKSIPLPANIEGIQTSYDSIQVKSISLELT